MKKYSFVFLSILIICSFLIGNLTQNIYSNEKASAYNDELPVEDSLPFETADYDYNAESLLPELQKYIDSNTAELNFKSDVEVADISDDGVVDSQDVNLLAQSMAGWNVAVNNEKIDVNCDGAINLKDLVLVAQLANKNSTETSEPNYLDKVLRNHENKNGAWSTRKPFITFTVDDGSSKDLTILKPIFQKYNVPCCPALICGDEWTVNNVEERLELQNYHGWEYMCHGVDEIPFNNKTVEQVEAEIVKSKTKLEELGFIINDIAYPSGSVAASDGTNLQPLIKKYFRAGYGFNPHPTILPNTGILNSYNIKRVPLGSFTMNTAYNGKGAEYYKSLEYYKECVDYAVANNAWCIFCLHSGAADFDETQQQYLDELIAYIQSINVDIGTLTEGYEIFGNYIECGDLENGFRVTNSGENNLPIHHNANLKPKNSTPITDFPLNKLTITETGYSNSTSGFPENTQGTLVTSRFEHYGFQLWFANSSNNIYKRNWNAANKKWLDWKIISNEQNSDMTFSKLCNFGQGLDNSYYMSMTKGIYIRSIEIVSSTKDVIAAEKMIPTKNYFNKSEISTNSKVEERTVLATSASGHKLLAYLSGSTLKLSFLKNDGSTKPNSLMVYVDLLYS